MKNTVIINEKDNVGINLTGNDVIPAGHKFALRDIKKGETVIKYGQVIGRATCDIKTGDWVLLTAEIKIEKHPMYPRRGPVLYARSTDFAVAPSPELATFY